MCLAVPHRIVKIEEGNEAIAEARGIKVKVRLDLIDNPEVGDWILVHAGFAIQKLNKTEAEEINEVWEKIWEQQQMIEG